MTFAPDPVQSRSAAAEIAAGDGSDTSWLSRRRSLLPDLVLHALGKARLTRASIRQGRRFKLLTYFSICSAVVMTCITVTFAFGYRWQLTTSMMAAAERHNVTFATSVANTLWGRFAQHLTSLNGVPRSEIVSRVETSFLDRELRLIAEGLPVLKLKIYDPSGLTVYSSDFRQIGENKATDLLFRSAYRDRVAASKMSFRTQFGSFKGMVHNVSVIESYVPFIGPDGQVQAIFELYTDISHYVDSIRRDVVMAIVFSVLASILLYSLLQLIVRHADSLIDWQHKELHQSLAAATKAEAEARAFAAELKVSHDSISTLNVELGNTVLRLREAQDESIRKGKMAQLGQLTATVAHEIRNPLGAVRTAAYLVDRKLQGKGLDVEKQFERINNGIKRCDMIITELLDFARASTLSLKAIAIDDWIGKCVEEESKSFASQVRFSLDLALPSTIVSVDADRMRRVMINLLSNACEAMVGRGKDMAPAVTLDPSIQISTRMTDGNVEIAVKDNGPGISEENIKRILEPLFTTKSFGIGLGLPAVEKILEQHGGGLRIESKPGEGATFTAWFPLQGAMMIAA